MQIDDDGEGRMQPDTEPRTAQDEESKQAYETSCADLAGRVERLEHLQVDVLKLLLINDDPAQVRGYGYLGKSVYGFMPLFFFLQILVYHMYKRFMIISDELSLSYKQDHDSASPMAFWSRDQ